MTITGADLIAAGFTPGKHFTAALAAANRVLADGGSRDQAIAAATSAKPAPAIPLDDIAGKPLHVNLLPDGDAEKTNLINVMASMSELLRTPVVRAGAVMPDACPAGPLGTIPVGGVVVSDAIHPGMHSADICCSMAISVVHGVTPAVLLDAVHKVTHFGPGARPQPVAMPYGMLGDFERSRLLDVDLAKSNFATQGDGNHFAYVGTLKSTGETALVTHHGSRGPGASLYNAGMKIAERYRRELSPATWRQNAWIPADTKDGDDYWSALQVIRDWTKANHYAIHDMALAVVGACASDRFWNEHNFVFRKSDGLFYHGKGATPAWDGWAADATDLTLIPLNMAEPILIVRGNNAPSGLGFSPHGAGRNLSRTAHKRLKADAIGADSRGMSPRDVAAIFAEETAGLDVRFYSGETDISELPSAYKNAAAVRAQIEQFGLAEVVDEVQPYGCIMAGDWSRNAPWRKKKEARS
jgi:tRNA-splicing ligase RtcB